MTDTNHVAPVASLPNTNHLNQAAQLAQAHADQVDIADEEIAIAFGHAAIVASSKLQDALRALGGAITELGEENLSPGHTRRFKDIAAVLRLSRSQLEPFIQTYHEHFSPSCEECGGPLP